jgi:hypothetical protein
MLYFEDYNEPVTVTMGDLILFSIEVKKNKAYFNLDYLKKAFAQELEKLNDPPIDYDGIYKTLSQVFKESAGDKIHLNYKTNEYDELILRLFSQPVKITRGTLKHELKTFKKLPSERIAEKHKEKEKEKAQKPKGVLPIRIPPGNEWIFAALDQESQEEYGKKNRSLMAFNIIRKYFEGKEKEKEKEKESGSV